MFDHSSRVEWVARYAELHCHTNYSFLDGASWAGDLVRRAADLGYEALAVTDHDGFRGVVQAHAHAREVGLPIVYGTEVGMPRGASGGKDADRPVDDIMDPDGDEVPVTGGDDPTRRGRVRRMHGSKPIDVPAES